MKQIKLTKLNIAALAVAAFYILEYFGLGIAIFKNMWNTSPAIPIVGAIVALLPAAAELLNIFIFKKRWLDIAVTGVSLALELGYFFFFAFVLSKLTYFLIAGKPYFITAGLAAVLVFFIFLFPRLNKTGKRVSAIALSFIIFIICLLGMFGATPFYLSSGATVFAVEDEYQIAFATSHNSTGAVIVNGKTYYDQKNGENNICPLHKISVPATELDKAKSYAILTQSVALNTGYLPSKGIKIQKQYKFRPVDQSDGLQIYNLSDTHEVLAGPAKAAAYFGDKLDLLILNGDIINDVSSFYQISLIYKLANRITDGERPVVYTRGNHECNGSLAADFNKYVGCGDRGFYYTYNVGPLSLLVLDTANDMADDSFIISPISNYDEYRAKQLEWLEGLNWEGGEYSFVLAHMPYALSWPLDERCFWHEFAQGAVKCTNEVAQLAICGDSHKTDFFNAGTAENPVANYPLLRGSLRSNKYPDKEGVSHFEFTGTALELKGGNVNIKFTNAKHKVLNEYDIKV